MSRTSLGFERTTCACAECVSYCHMVPGYLIPDDLEPVAKAAGCADILELASKYLLASPGAIVSDGTKQWRIPTLVPARQENGSCVFLVNERCGIHEVCPFACAFFDGHMSDEEFQKRRVAGIQTVATAWHTDTPYSLLWKILDTMGRCAIPPEIAWSESLAIEARKQLG